MTAFIKPDPEVLAWIEDKYRKGEPTPNIYVYSAPLHLRFECQWCAHDEHGFKCSSCKCDSSYDRRDDTWRTARRLTDEWKIAETMDTLGCDGWVARIVHHKPPYYLPAHRRQIIENALFGRSA